MLLSDYFKGNRKQKIKQFNDLSASGKIMEEFRNIFPTAVEGRVDTLFILKGAECCRFYDETQRTLHLDSKQHTRNIHHADLYNIVAIHALRNGGSVYLEGPEGMPLKGTEINALLRY